MNNKFQITLLIGILAAMGCSIWSTSMSTANAQSNYTIKVAKTTQGDFTVTEEQAMLIQTLTQYIL